MAVPLTTTFVPPPECTQDIRRQSGNETESYLLLGGKATNTCLPSFFTPTFTFFYSPGLYCPSGYLDNGYTKTLASVTETIVTCCPSGYTTIDTTALENAWESTLGCRSLIVPGDTLTWIDEEDTTLTWTASTTEPIHAYSVQIRFQASDLITTTSSTTLPSATPSTSRSTGSIQTGEVSINNNDNNNSGGGLSTGAKAGIGVGAAIGVLLVAAIIFLALTIRKKSRPSVPLSNYHAADFPEWALPAEQKAPIMQHQDPNLHSSQYLGHGMAGGNYARPDSMAIHELQNGYGPVPPTELSANR